MTDELETNPVLLTYKADTNLRMLIRKYFKNQRIGNPLLYIDKDIVKLTQELTDNFFIAPVWNTFSMYLLIP